ncbi:hypothetical protein ACT54M_09850 [Leptospira santarosai]|uniref:hypothetical protein n=1 Tax=Leptospira santarosai TaxID=28183 RepID=UPI000964E266|nr:hypothetical protein [Leptospira santarosai]OLY61723.1 hypothetical protein BV917_03890 [Leptospira santarosai serovar Guaricura]
MEPQNQVSKTKRIILHNFLGMMLFMVSTFVPFLALNGQYGSLLFVAFPLSTGLLIVTFVFLISAKDSKWKLLYVGITTLLVIVFSVFMFLLYGKEGLICVLMALPLIIVLLFIGGLIGSFIYHKIWSKYLIILTVLFFNVSSYVYDRNDQNFEKREVQTSIEIDASKREVWERIVSPFEFGEAENFFLRNGVSYPVSMKIEESNGSRFLYCDYTNGTTIAKVDVFVDLEKLGFSFQEPQVTMRETSFYGEVEPKHIRGRVWAEFGEFRLEAVTEHRTKVIARTKYVNNLGPKFYWELWEDYLMDEMHRHVLVKIKNRIERR